MANIFYLISTDIAKNYDNGSSKFTLKFHNNRVIPWLVKEKVFELSKIETPCVENDNKYVYHIHNINEAHNSVSMQLEQELHKRIKKKKYELQQELGSQKCNDIFRQELECPNWDEDILAKMNMGREKLDPYDSCAFQLYIQSKGFKDFYDYLDFISENPTAEIEDNVDYENWNKENVYTVDNAITSYYI